MRPLHLLSILLLTVIGMMSWSSAWSRESSQLEVGMAAQEFQIPAWTSIGGFGFGARRSTGYDENAPESHRAHLLQRAVGQLDPVRAKAMVLRSNHQKIVFLSLDLLLLPVDLKVRIFKMLQDLGYDSDHIFLSVTHSHSSVGGYTETPVWAVTVLDFFHQELTEELLRASREAVITAEQQLEPATLYKSVFQTSGIQKNRSLTNGPVDRKARILYARATNGAWIGGLLNYPVHGNALFDDNLFISSDVPGSLERNLEAALARANGRLRQNHPTVLFVSSAAGDVDPLNRGYDFVNRAGQLFARQAIANIGQAHSVAFDGWKIYKKTVAMNSPVFRTQGCDIQDTEAYTQFAKLQVNIPAKWLFPNHTEVSQISLGGIRFLNFPGELSTALYQEFVGRASAMTKEDLWVLTLTNDYLLYFVRKEDFDSYPSVENCLSVFGPEGGRLLLNAHTALIQGVR